MSSVGPPPGVFAAGGSVSFWLDALRASGTTTAIITATTMARMIRDRAVNRRAGFDVVPPAT
jgi:hypothetical protein